MNPAHTTQQNSIERRTDMTRKVMSISDWNNQFTCIRDTSKEQEYALYTHYCDIGKNGYPVNHRKLIGRYPTLYHVVYAMKDMIV